VRLLGQGLVKSDSIVHLSMARCVPSCAIVRVSLPKRCERCSSTSRRHSFPLTCRTTDYRTRGLTCSTSTSLRARSYKFYRSRRWDQRFRTSHKL
jgi:hypothetical protein